jgi:hypothetical protein
MIAAASAMMLGLLALGVRQRGALVYVHRRTGCLHGGS